MDIFCLVGADQTFAWPSSCMAPMQLSQVCRMWRKITLRCSRLWSSIDISMVYRLDRTNNLDSLSRITHIWIQRSAACTFYFNLHIDTHSDPTPLELLIPLIDLLLAACTRWGCVSINLCGYDEDDFDSERWGDVGTCRFPRLERLIVSASHNVFQHVNQRLNIKPSTTPALRSFNVRAGSSLAPVSRPLDASFNALTELSISSFASREDIFHVMSQCVRVQKLYIDMGRIMIGPPLLHVMDIYIPSSSIVAGRCISQWV